MIFSSLLFLVYFLPLFLGIYLLLPGKFRNYWLLIASVVFYAWGAPRFIFVVLASIILDYMLVSWMSVRKDRARLLLAGIAIATNIAMLTWFKYANFAVETIQAILLRFGLGPGSWVNIALPIGISFFTFQKITYVVDVYRGVTRIQRSLPDYAMYVLMFPQLIAGPIVRYHEISDQIENRRGSTDMFISGFFRFAIGLARKVLVADTLAGFANPVFAADPECLPPLIAWSGLLAYTFQIYHDFAGYSDMAIGLGRMMGFELPENFRNPYRSGSITEFWRRWHISLSSFMRDYLYIPLGGNRKGRSRVLFNLVFVFLVSGLWHGAAWNFVLWGAWHGLFLLVDRFGFRRWLGRFPKMVAAAVTFAIVMFGWVLFRTDDMQHFSGFLLALAGQEGYCELMSIGSEYILLIALSFAWSAVAIIPSVESWQERVMSALPSRRIYWAVGIACLLYLLAIAWLFGTEVHPFIYFRF